MSSLLNQFAYGTPDLPGVGGVIKQRHEDFLVEEQPVGDLDGEGEHLYLYIEKRGATTTDIAHRIAKGFRIGKREIGWAGLKDKHAITRQQFSVHLPGKHEYDEAKAFQHIEARRGTKILWTERHGRKLRRGHHAGNRFVIYVRDVSSTAAVQAKPILDWLTQNGMPNFVGEQRFGFRQNGHALGRLLLRREYQAFLDELLGHDDPADSNALKKGRAAYHQGNYLEALKHWPKPLRYDRQALDALRQHLDAEQAVLSIDIAQRGFLLSAMQSHLFNLALDQRLRNGTWNQLVAGGVAAKLPGRAVFNIDAATAAEENAPGGRMERFEVSPTGPLWGPGMVEPEGETYELEQKVLVGFGVTADELMQSDNKKLEGQRRPLRIPIKDADLSSGVDEHGAYLRVVFELPRGTYATVALREMCKCDLHETVLASKNKATPEASAP